MKGMKIQNKVLQTNFSFGKARGTAGISFTTAAIGERGEPSEPVKQNFFCPF
jgi:hypothetical protein